MKDLTSWQSANEEHLAAAVEWLRLLLARSAGDVQSSPEGASEVTDAAIEEATAAMSAAASSDPPPALLLIGHLFGLSQHELNTLLLCVAMELDTGIATHCARAQGNPNQAYPTFALALSLFDEPSWDVLSSDRPLRYWQLIQLNQREAQPLTTSPLRADERIVNYLKGLNTIDDRLMPFLIPLEAVAGETWLPPSQQATVDAILTRLEQMATGHSLPVVQLLGPDRDNKQLIARHVTNVLGVSGYHLPVRLLPRHISEIEEIARLWQRESILLPVALYLDTQELDETEANNEMAPLLNRFLSRSGGLFFLDTRDLWSGMDTATIFFDISKPTPAEQMVAWSSALDGLDPEIPALLASQFNLNLSAINDIASGALSQVLPEQELTKEEKVLDTLWQSSLAHTRPRLDVLAQRLVPKATWEDIVLPNDQVNLLRQITDQVRQRGIVYEEWGFRQKLSRGLGIMVLFTGESGTGKTMSAEVIANDLNLNLYRIDLSGVVSKYIGETEKNLRRLFDAAEDGGAILFFDEADALFGKRSQVKDSHDRYANIEINYLLQRMEAYQGLAILSTNRRSNLDDAFVRRLRFIVSFPVPDAGDRQQIWQKIFPEMTPTQDLDYDRLAQFKLTGGSINNIALNAAFLAARDRSSIMMSHILGATRAEFLKMDRLINEHDYVLDNSD
jgi:ATP-dependent 26S proteasome regulatory subunit